MPEGDTLHRLAARLAPVLEGAPVVRLTLPRSLGRVESAEGRRVERVAARGKNLLIHLEGALVLHTHLKMNGRWHLYGVEQPWRRSPWSAVAVLEVPAAVAVCFDAPIARCVAEAELGLDDLGPDLASAAFDAAEALRRLRERPAAAIADALLDQRALAGIGNVYKSEVLFACGVDPFAPVAALDDATLERLVTQAAAWLRRNVAKGGERETRVRRGPGERALAVYGRPGEPCYTCDTRIVVRRQGDPPRATYFCPHCQRVRPDGPRDPRPLP